MKFTYKIKDNEGKAATGSIDVGSQQEALKLLRDRDYLVISLEEQRKGMFASKSSVGFINRVSFNTVVDFTRQLSTMVTAGLPLIDGLSILSRQETNGQFKSIIETIMGRIRGGETFAKSLGAYPAHFNQMYVSLVEAGERSGKLDSVLERIADTLEKQRTFRSRVKTAMVYPVIIVIGMVLLMAMMMIFVVPKLTEIYKQFDLDLPITTQLLIFTSNIFVYYWWALLLAIAVFIVWFSSFSRSLAGKAAIDTIVLRLPIWGSLKRDMVMGELTRTLGLLVGSGVPILDGLTIVADALESPTYTRSVKKIATNVERGFALGILFSRESLFPPIVGQMVTVGEETGKMDETLTRVAMFFETSSDEKVKRLTTALEPIILVALGGGVAFLVLSIVMPLYQLTQAF